MKNTFYNVLALFCCVLLFSHCAKKGSPDGGPKDSIPPIIVKSNPENFTTNFEGEEIRIYFDEYIKLKNLQQNLIVSPPLQYQPVITPITSAKVLKIKIQDTLKENATYVFNFGKSIVDNNEENEFEYFKYVFSTGSYIDSLSIKGRVNDILLPNLEGKATVMLYELTETFKDSIIYFEKPTYVSTTKEKDPTFELTNLKEGQYLLVALLEEPSNYTFQPKKDKIAFHPTPITLPGDSTAVLNLFMEIPHYRFNRASHISKNKIAFGYEGQVDSLNIEPLFDLPSDYSYRLLKDPNKDSLNYWFKPAVDPEVTDTLKFKVTYRETVDTVDVRIRDLYADSLELKMTSSATLIPRDTLFVSSNTPLDSLYADRFVITDRDSTLIQNSAFLDRIKNRIGLLFDKKEETVYRITVLPEALVDFFGNKNDTLELTARTRALSDYGTINFKLVNLKDFPVLIELVDEKKQVQASEYLTENKEVYFDYLDPGNYFLRIIVDANKNGKWDSGNYLEKRQPEKVIYYPKSIEIRANWSLNELFTLD